MLAHTGLQGGSRDRLIWAERWRGWGRDAARELTPLALRESRPSLSEERYQDHSAELGWVSPQEARPQDPVRRPLLSSPNPVNGNNYGPHCTCPGL